VPTYRLETFGKLALGGGASRLSHQRRRLALLALLAASGERGLSRDQLLAFLWPESAAGNARHSLEQLLHELRRALGESVFSGVNPVRLNSEVIASDVAEFDRALSRGALADAVALYGGPFLQGFYLDDAPEFERWTTTERARLADRYADALNRLAVDAEKSGDHAAAVRWRRRLAEADPVGSRSALALMRALVAGGDRTAALQHARIYEALIQQEFESAPDPSITSYAAALRAGSADQRANIPAPKTAGGSDARSDATTVTKTAADQPVGALETTLTPRSPVSREFASPIIEEATPHRWRSWWLAGIPVGAAILLLAALAGRNREKVPVLDPNKIVVVPFRTSGVDSSVKYLGEGVVDLIAPMLTGEGGPIAVDSRTAISTWNRMTRGRDGTAGDARQVARELGAGLVLTGAVVEVGGKLTITGNVIPSGAGDARPLTSVSAPIDSVDRLLDQFVGQLLTRQSGVAETSVSAITSQSLPAIRAYLNGRVAYRRANEDQAIDNFSRALEIDSTFALAALDLAVATGKIMRTEICLSRVCRVYSNVPGLATSERGDGLFNRAVHLAWAYRFKLGRRDRPLLDALRGENYPRASSARETLANLGRAVVAAPDRPETHYLLGTLLLYQGLALGLSDSRERSAAAFRAASQLDPSYLAPLARMVDVAAFGGDTATLRRAGVLYLSRDTVGTTADYVRWLVAAGTSDSAAHLAIRARLSSLNRATLDHIYLTSQMSGLALEDADSAAKLLTETTADPADKSIALRRESLLALNRGRPSEATRLLRRLRELRTQGGYVFENFTMDAAQFNDGERAVSDSSARELARKLARDTVRPLSPDARRPTSVAMLGQTMWYLERGDTVRAAAATGWLQRHTEGQSRNSVFSVVPAMLIATRARRPEGAVLRALVDSMALDGCCALPPFVNFELARAYEESGDEAGALRVIRRGVWYNPPRMLATQLREEGRLAARLGDRTGAIRAYEHYLALRSNPEPVLLPQRDSIRAEVNRLKRPR
jgi:DNA-binding SARP family transcriptional activator/TolB-like protein